MKPLQKDLNAVVVIAGREVLRFFKDWKTSLAFSLLFPSRSADTAQAPRLTTHPAHGVCGSVSGNSRWRYFAKLSWRSRVQLPSVCAFRNDRCNNIHEHHDERNITCRRPRKRFYTGNLCSSNFTVFHHFGQNRRRQHH